jgi:Rod binding domain-containing protein
MNIAGSTIQSNAMSLEEMHGLRRTKPLNTTLGAVGKDVRRGAPVVTNLSAGKPALQTHVTAQDLKAPTTAHKSNLTQHEQLVKQTQKWVSQAFFGTMLKQMREDPFRSEMFDGGRGGQAFGAMYDQELASRMARGAGSKLVNTIVKHIEARSGQVQQQMQFNKMQQAIRQQQSAVDAKQLQTQMPSEVR